MNRDFAPIFGRAFVRYRKACRLVAARPARFARATGVVKSAAVSCRASGGKIMRTIVWCLGFVSAFAQATAQAERIPLRDFVRRAEFDQVKLSPDGAFLAVTIPGEDRTGLAIMRIADRKITAALNFRGQEHAADFWWVSDKRVVATLAKKEGSLARPQETGELFGLDADSGKSAYLFGYRGEDSVGSHINRATKERASAYMLDPLRDDPDFALIVVRPWESRNAGVDQVFKLNVYSGAKASVLRAPAQGQAEFLADWQGRVRYATVRDTQYKLRAFSRLDEKSPWSEETTGALAGAQIEPLVFSADGSRVYLDSTEDGDVSCLVEQQFQPAARRKLACNFHQVIYSFDGKQPIGVVDAAGKPALSLLEGAHPDRALMASLVKSFGGDFVLPVSGTRDGSKGVLLVYSDRNPGDFYMFDKSTKKAEYLFSRRSWIDPVKMGERRAIRFNARDGHTLHGYLTLPPGGSAKNLPLVVNPHGGPFGIRDRWNWDAEPQLLASRGYAVLQVNFRGSGGYGRAHHDAGKHGWGTVMIDDITDGARWVAAQGLADPQRSCIYGSSYGGYAALMSAVREPELYRCAIGYVGVYDLPNQVSDTDTSRYLGGQSYIREYIGDTEKLLTAQSPLTYINRLKAAVFIAHGTEDRRVPFSQAKALSAALDQRKVPYEWLAKSGEGHGFYREENRLEFYEKMLAFLEAHIGGEAKAAAPG